MAVKEKLRTGLQYDGDLFSLKYFGVSSNFINLKRGSNVITLSPSSYIVKGSIIELEVIHESGVPIRVLNDNKRTTDGNLVLIIQVPEETPAGAFSLYILGTSSRDFDSGVYLDTSSPNTVWHGISRLQDSEVRVSDSDDLILKHSATDIKITVDAVDVPYSELPQNRSTSSAFNFPVEYFPVPISYSTFPKLDSSLVNSNSKLLNSGSSSITQPSPLAPYGTYPTLICQEPVFTRDMKGALISLIPNISSYIPSNAVNSLPTLPEYSTSIVQVVNTTTIRVSDNFQYKIEPPIIKTSLSVDKFKSDQFTIDYNTSEGPFQGQKITGYARICAKNVETLNGKIAKVKVGTKPIGAIGSSTDLGSFTPYYPDKLTNPDSYYSNILYDPISGVQSKSASNVFNAGDVSTNFDSFIVDKNSTILGNTSASYDDSKLLDSVNIAETSPNQYSILTIKDFLTAPSVADTEYELSFEAYCTKLDKNTNPELDIYIKGPSLQVGSFDNTLGTFIGNLKGSSNQHLNPQVFKFKTLSESESTQPLFKIKSGQWSLSKVSIKASSNPNNSPNELCVDVPLDNVGVSKLNQEYVFQVDFIGSNGKPLNLNINTNSLPVNRNSTLDEILILNTLQSSSNIQNYLSTLIGAGGAQGPQGPVGYQGLVGEGPQGYQGILGPQGYQGILGIQGYQGILGPQGLVGYQGSQGLEGDGLQGFTGATGPQGRQGLQGLQGLEGMGLQGYTGTTGPQGRQGLQGLQGYAGLNGIGLTGAQGPQGLQGIAVSGPQGYTGTTGPQGWQGLQGLQGYAGLNGIGLTGAQGPQGLQGSSCFVKETLISTPTGDIEIQHLSVNDIVKCFDFNHQSIEDCRILKVHERSTKEIFIINNQLITTGEHPFFIVDELPGSWKKARELVEGDLLFNIDGNSEVIYNITTLTLKRSIPVYNLMIEGHENFYASNLLVHNASDTDWKIGPQGPQGPQGLQGADGWV